MTDGSNFVLAWMRDVRDSALESTTKLVLLTLGTRMDPDGGNCYPSIRTLCGDTSLSNKSVIRHLDVAEREGWIERQQAGRSGQGWKRNRYLPCLPQGGEPATPRQPEGGGVSTPPSGEGGEPLSKKVVNEVHSTSTNNTSSVTDGETWAKKKAWPIYLEELGGNGRQPSPLKSRLKKITALYSEQLEGEDHPDDAFRAILREVKSSDHHMSNRDWQMPESLFRNAERRERWTMKALNDGGGDGGVGDGDTVSRDALDAYDGGSE